jgi:hypothetical protein
MPDHTMYGRVCDVGATQLSVLCNTNQHPALCRNRYNEADKYDFNKPDFSPATGHFTQVRRARGGRACHRDCAPWVVAPLLHAAVHPHHSSPPTAPCGPPGRVARHHPGWLRHQAVWRLGARGVPLLPARQLEGAVCAGGFPQRGAPAINTTNTVAPHAPVRALLCNAPGLLRRTYWRKKVEDAAGGSRTHLGVDGWRVTWGCHVHSRHALYQVLIR